MSFLKCMNKDCSNLIPINKVGDPNPKPMRWKYKSKYNHTQINVCESCWQKARSLKVPERE